VTVRIGSGFAPQLVCVERSRGATTRLRLTQLPQFEENDTNFGRLWHRKSLAFNEGFVKTAM
jgi:hypothetical protein